jgi:hypothetical protein
LTPFLDVNGDVDVDSIVDLDLDAREPPSRRIRSVNVRRRGWSRRLRCRQPQRRPSTFTSMTTSPSKRCDES